MKFICSQADLNTHLSLVSRAVPSRPSHPVLANVLLIADADEQTVELTGFDLSLGIRTSFAAMVTASGSLTIPAKIFNDIISKLSGGDLTIEENTEDESVISIISDSGRYQVRGMSADEFPELPLIEDGEVVYLPPDDLISGLRGTLFAASPDETKQVLTGVHLKVEKEELEFAATDGHRLALVQTPSETSVESELEMTIPAKALREVERMLMANQALETVGLRFDESQIVFEIGTQKLTSRKLEGQYPVYRQLIPQKFVNQINIDRKQFLNGVERIAVLADQRNNILKCTINNKAQSISLSVDAKEVGSGEESMTAQITGDEPKEIAFNVKYLIDGLKAISVANEIQLQLNSSTSPVIVKPLSGAKMIYLIMPVQLRN